ncbi:hypothetical protein K1719_021068 [Acacia pycnantha]|nr:hypothetical protein K1719_021068 [Acacia pycnantha]
MSLMQEMETTLAFLPSLDLKRQDFQRLKFFHQFVDKMLKFVDLKSVKKFVLRLGYDETDEYFRPQKISRWINAMMTTKVEHLELHLMPRKGDYELPSSVFTTNNIKVLMLSGSTGFVGWIRTVTVGTLSHVNLPLLEVLHLKDVKFSDDRSLGMLLSACALLKHLVLIDLYGKFNCPLDIGGLNHLVTADVPQFLFPLKVFSNARFLRFHLRMLQNLLLVKVTPVPDIPTFYNLTHLEFRYFSYDWNTTLKYLQSCPKLEILVIGQFFCSEILESMIIDVPQYVSSSLKEFHLSGYQGENGDFDLARFIMKNAMVLRIISITNAFGSKATWKNRNLKKISTCLISSMNCKLLLLE